MLPFATCSLRNGRVDKGKLAIRPPTFEALLERITNKLTLPDEPFIARRLFTPEGFEVEEIDEVCDGDTLVASQGEEFEPPTLDEISLGRSPTASSLASGWMPRRLAPTLAAVSGSTALSDVGRSAASRKV